MATQVGLSDLYYAKLTTDPADGAATYETPVRIVGAITANITANSESATLFADNGPLESATAMGAIDLELNVADLPLDVQAILLGHTVNANGTMYRNSNDTPPFVAIGFKALKSNGKYRYVWLLKGKFQIPDLNHQTKEDSIEFQTSTINGSFVKRDSDSNWIFQADEDLTGYVETVGTNWFTSPDSGKPVV